MSYKVSLNPSALGLRRTWPAGSVINVRDDYNAKADGVTDATAAIQAAIKTHLTSDRRPLFFPAGTYLISAALLAQNTSGVWKAGLTMFGEIEEGTIIRLKDGTATTVALPLIKSASNSANTNGENNQAFNNFLHDLTLDVGQGNPFAIGADWIGNNNSSLRRVTLRSRDGQGKAGIALTRAWPGPMLGSQLTIDGFEYGIDVGQDQYSVTVEGLNLRNQLFGGIRTNDNVLSLRQVTSDNVVPAIVSNGGNKSSAIWLYDSNLVGGRAGRSAVETAGLLYARNVFSAGYDSALKLDGVIVPGSYVSEYASHGRVDPGDVGASFAIPVAETPRYENWDLTDWTSGPVGRTNLTNERNDAPFLDRMFASGEPVVHILPGKYRIAEGLHVPAEVKKILAYGVELDISTGTTVFSDGAAPVAAVSVEGDTVDPLFVEGLTFSNYNNQSVDGLALLRHASPRPLVLKDIAQFGYAAYSYMNSAGCGELFMDNVGMLSPWRFDFPQNVWARQWNPENHDNGSHTGPYTLSKTGGSLWVLGMKTEDPTQVLQSTFGDIEISGGFFFGVRAVAAGTKLMVLNNVRAKLGYVTHQLGSVADFQDHISDNGTITPRTALQILNNHAANVLWLSENVAPRAGVGTGLNAEYYDNGYYSTDFTGLVGTRTDAQINFDWGYSIPAGTGLTNKDQFSVRWTGFVLAPRTGNYNFRPLMDAQSRTRIWVNGVEVTAYQDVALTAGQKYSIKVEYVHNNYNARIKLLWSFAGGAAQIVPGSALFKS